jgi:hypothetical protein
VSRSGWPPLSRSRGSAPLGPIVAHWVLRAVIIDPATESDGDCRGALQDITTAEAAPDSSRQDLVRVMGRCLSATGRLHHVHHDGVCGVSRALPAAVPPAPTPPHPLDDEEILALVHGLTRLDSEGARKLERALLVANGVEVPPADGGSRDGEYSETP